MNRHTMVFPKTYTTRNLRKRVPLEGQGTGFTTVDDGVEGIYYSTEIDIDQLHDMARKAAANSTPTSTRGPIRVKIISRKKVS